MTENVDMSHDDASATAWSPSGRMLHRCRRRCPRASRPNRRPRHPPPGPPRLLLRPRLQSSVEIAGACRAASSAADAVARGSSRRAGGAAPACRRDRSGRAAWASRAARAGSVGLAGHACCAAGAAVCFRRRAGAEPQTEEPPPCGAA